MEKNNINIPNSDKICWKNIENCIEKEMSWLRENIIPFQINKNPLHYSDIIFYRLIAILIVAGKITVTEKVSKNTINVYIHGIKLYLYYLKKYLNFTLNFELEDIKILKRDRPDIKEINIASIEDKLKLLNDNRSIKSQRDFIVFQLIMKTGIRISDLVDIKKDQIRNNRIDLGSNIYPLDDELNLLIINFINQNNTTSEYLLTPFSANTKNTSCQLTTRSIERTIKENFPDISYNDLKMVYFKKMMNNLPDIRHASSHYGGGRINIYDLCKII